MAGSIGVPCSDTGRYTAFADSLANLEKPPGTISRFAVCTWRQRGRNQLVRWMLEANEEWMLFLDDDHVFAPDLLARLLSHEKDIVAALCLRRDEPYSPFCFQAITASGKFQAIDLHQHAADELLQVATVGTGAMLVRRRVFEQLADPWFKIAESGEDMLFCQAAACAGFEIYCDLGARLGHLTTAVVWPTTTEKGWSVGFVISDQTRILRDLSPPEAIEA